MKHGPKKENALTKLASRPLQSQINVTPFVDVCLVLLIIFMVVTPMLQKGIPVLLPKTESPEKTPENEKQLIISVKDDGTVYLGSLVVRGDEVKSELKDIFQRTPDREIAVKGDKRVEYGEVLKVLRACREAGFENIGLIAEPIKRAGEGT